MINGSLKIQIILDRSDNAEKFRDFRQIPSLSFNDPKIKSAK